MAAEVYVRHCFPTSISNIDLMTHYLSATSQSGMTVKLGKTNAKPSLEAH